jgi:response regulator RpfG family c-di-GMP phosphodiesterase
MKSRQSKNKSLAKKYKNIRKIHRKTKQLESRLCISNQTLEAINQTLLNKIQELESHIINLINMNTEADSTILNIMNTMNSIETENIELINRLKNLEKQVKSKLCCIM